MKKVLVLMGVAVLACLGSWSLWGGTYEGYVPVLVKVQVLDASDERPIPDAILIVLKSTDQVDDREYLEKAIARSLQQEPGRLDDNWTDLLWPVHAKRTGPDGSAAVVDLARVSGATLGEWPISRSYHKSQPDLALIRAPGHAEARIELRSFIEGPVGDPEHMIADLGSVRLTRE